MGGKSAADSGVLRPDCRPPQPASSHTLVFPTYGNGSPLPRQRMPIALGALTGERRFVRYGQCAVVLHFRSRSRFNCNNTPHPRIPNHHHGNIVNLPRVPLLDCIDDGSADRFGGQRGFGRNQMAQA